MHPRLHSSTDSRPRSRLHSSTHLRHVHARHLGQRQQQLAAGRRRAARWRQLPLQLQQPLGEAGQKVLAVACRAGRRMHMQVGLRSGSAERGATQPCGRQGCPPKHGELSCLPAPLPASTTSEEGAAAATSQCRPPAHARRRRQLPAGTTERHTHASTPTHPAARRRRRRRTARGWRSARGRPQTPAGARRPAPPPALGCPAAPGCCGGEGREGSWVRRRRAGKETRQMRAGDALQRAPACCAKGRVVCGAEGPGCHTRRSQQRPHSRTRAPRWSQQACTSGRWQSPVPTQQHSTSPGIHTSAVPQRPAPQDVGVVELPGKREAQQVGGGRQRVVRVREQAAHCRRGRRSKGARR